MQQRYRTATKTSPKITSLPVSAGYLVMRWLRLAMAAMGLLCTTFSGATAAFARVELTIAEAIRLGQQHSAAIQAAREESVASAAKLIAAKTARLATFSLAATSFSLDHLPKADFPFRTIEFGSRENYQIDLRLLWPLYTGGRLSAGVKAQTAMHKAACFDLESQNLAIAYSVRKTYLNLLLAKALLNAALGSQKRLQLVAEDVNYLYLAGMADSLDILQAQLACVRGEKEALSRHAAQSNAETVLKNLIGIDPDEDLILRDTLLEPSSEILPTDLLPPIERPELGVAASRAEAAWQNATAERAAYLPSVAIYGGYSYGKPNRDLFNKTWNDYWVTGITLNWQLTLGGSDLQRARAARRSARSLDANARQLRESLTIQAQISANNLRVAYETATAAKKEWEIAERQFKLASDKHKVGGLAMNQLLQMEADLKAAEELYHASIVNLRLAETEYLYATGSPRLYGEF